MDLARTPNPHQPPAETCFTSQVDEATVAGDDADMDSQVRSVSCFELSSSTPSHMDPHTVHPPKDIHDDDRLHDVTEHDPLSYHSDFDYYTQSFDSDSDSLSDSGLATAHSHSPRDVPVTPVASVMRSPPSSPPHPRARPETNMGAPQDTRPLWRNPRPSGGLSSRGDVNNSLASRRRPSLSSTELSSSSDDEDRITVYYSLDGMSNGALSRTHSRTCSRYSKAGPGSDDDVPLAQRVPTALSAQKSIRKQLHDERQQRRLDRVKSSRPPSDSRTPSRPTELPTGLRKRSLSAAPSLSRNPLPAPPVPFPVEDLSRKLASLQSSSRPPPLPTVTSPSSRVPAYGGGLSRSSSRGRHTDRTVYQIPTRVPDPPSQDRPLKSMRSFHPLDGRHSESQQSSAHRLGRSTTAVTAARPLRGRDPSVGYDQYVPKSARNSEDGRKPSATVPRPSVDKEGDIAQRSVPRPPVPPLPISDSTPPQLVSRVPVVQQRIFIGDMQRFNIVEIAPTTNAGAVIATVASQGMLDNSGSWMLFEMAQDYGMERPIREYELLADVSASWNKDKMLNAFVIKPTPLAPLLSRSALPTSSPTHRGWVEWESKRGKWSKRWMEVREHGIWLSKRDTGKDEVFLCSLSNFDGYFVTRRHKSPKSFVFAIKSTDHLSLFENAADYLHVFSCNPKDGETWMQVILVARSYVLYQERHVLFAKPTEPLSQAKPLTRSRTRKQSVSNRPVQPLVSVPPPFSQASTTNVAFEPGSLLAKRKGDA